MWPGTVPVFWPGAESTTSRVGTWRISVVHKNPNLCNPFLKIFIEEAWTSGKLFHLLTTLWRRSRPTSECLLNNFVRKFSTARMIRIINVFLWCQKRRMIQMELQWNLCRVWTFMTFIPGIRTWPVFPGNNTESSKVIWMDAEMARSPIPYSLQSLQLSRV